MAKGRAAARRVAGNGRRGVGLGGKLRRVILGVVPLLVLTSGWVGAEAAFTATTFSSANSLASAVSFPDYPSAVIADNPLVYYRLDDAAGSVTAADASGHGTTGVYGTANGAPWSGLWPMDDNSGATAADLSGASAPHDLTLSGATWTSSGRSKAALSLNGTSGYAATAAPVLTTSSSFSVSAWVYLTDSSTSRTAVSQDGSAVSAFELGYDQASNRWAFAMPRTDSAAAPVDVITSGSAPTLNTWTQLTATFNAATNGMDLYVNGVQQVAGVFGGTAWNATGALEVGAGQSTTRTHYWAGRLDTVRVNAAVVGTATALELTMGSTGGPSTSWQLDENTGTSTVDSSGNLNSATLGSAATWATAKSGASSVDVPGDMSGNGYVDGSSPAVNTTRSFTVSAWVYLDHTALNTMSRVALSQSGNIKPGFSLRYNHYGQQWQFAVGSGADDYSGAADSSFSPAFSAALNTWTHLAGVYNAVTQDVTLYVDGVAQTPAGHTLTFDAAGPLQVGRVKEFGSWQVGGIVAVGPWAGRVDDARTYRRALDAAEITALYRSANPGSSLGLPGALQGAQQGQASSTAQAFADNARNSYDPVPTSNPTTYTLECWFRSRGIPGTVNGHTLLAYSDKASGTSGSHDRRVYLDSGGHVVAGTSSGTTGTASTTSTYTDGAWHHVAATISPAGGIKLYLDGALAATAAYSAPANFAGYWRWGGDTWAAAWPADYYWLGQLDEVAVYTTELSATQIAIHYHANH